jgi:hypothetical protein
MNHNGYLIGRSSFVLGLSICGARGRDRTCDTGFGEHAAGVTGYGVSCAIVLHRPGFSAVAISPVVSRVGP